MTELSLMQRFADPTLFQEMSKSEMMQGALVTTVMGMGTTFVVLLLLWSIIAVLSRLIQSTEKKKSSVSIVPTPKAVSNVTATPVVENKPEGASTEVIAVIMAAIAAMEGTANTNHLIIRKINRVSGNSTAWSKAGASEVIESRKF